MPKGLKEKAASGFKWLVINNFIKKGLQIVSVAFLARILEPKTFGLFAMAFIAIDGFSLFKAFGVDMGLIQRKDQIEEAKHTAFFIVQAFGLSVFLLFQLLAPFAAHFLKNDEVVTIMRALGFVFLFGSLGRIPGAMLQKEMRFRLISVIDLISSVVNSVCSVIFAMISPTVWALVWAYLMRQLVIAGLNWYFERYTVKFVFDRKIAKELLHFGKYMVLMAVLAYVSNNLSSVLISRILGPAALGYFLLSINITFFTHAQVFQHMSQVLFPAYSKVQDDPEAMKRGFLKINRFMCMLTIPFGLAVIFLAKDLVLTIYGPKWLATVPLIQILALTQFLIPFDGGAGSVYMGVGKPAYIYWIQVLGLAVKTLVLAVIMPRYGIVAAAWACFAEELITTPVNYILIRRLVKCTLRELLGQLVPTFICSLVMLAAILGARALVGHWDILQTYTFKHRQILPLLVVGSSAAVAFAGSLFLIDRDAVMEVKNLIWKRAA